MEQSRPDKYAPSYAYQLMDLHIGLNFLMRLVRAKHLDRQEIEIIRSLSYQIKGSKYINSINASIDDLLFENKTQRDLKPTKGNV